MRSAPAAPASRFAVTLLALAVFGAMAVAVIVTSSSASSPTSTFPSARVTHAIELAATTYGGGSWLWRVARCETGGTFYVRARNRSSGALGLFQFLASTWRSTPYGRYSRTDPYAAALAAGWMRAHGRAGEWVCR